MIGFVNLDLVAEYDGLTRPLEDLRASRETNRGSPGVACGSVIASYGRTGVRAGTAARRGQGRSADDQPSGRVTLRHRRVVAQFVLAEPDPDLVLGLVGIARSVHEVGDGQVVRVRIGL